MQALATPETMSFGPFVLDVGARALLAGGERLTLSSRAFDILALLVAERDRVVSKEEILAKVWRGIAVEENNLAVQMSALRRVLAEHAEGQTIILTVPGQGYRFVSRLEPPATGRAPGIILPEHVPSPAPAAPSAGRQTSYRPWMFAACVAVLALGAAGFGARYWNSETAPRLSIAVLPFRNLGDDRAQDYLADAISDDLTTDLAHLPGSVVIARESSDVYKGRAVPAQQIGHALNVRYLLEGSLRGVEGIFHVNAQLIDASTGTHLWAEAFDVPRSKLADTQAAIVRNIASALDVRLVAIESERSKRERQDNPDAFDLYLQARSIHDQGRSLTQLREAQGLLEKALRLQPGYVAAMADLALLLLEKGREHDNPDEAVDVAHARALVEQALTIEPNNVKALTARGLEQHVEGRLGESEASLRTALDLDPNNLEAMTFLARDESRLGKSHEAADIYNRILQLDPQGPDSQKRTASLGMAYFMEGRFADSISTILRSLAADARESSAGGDRIEFSNMFLIAAYDLVGNKDIAREIYQKYKMRWPHRSVWRLCSYFSKAQANQPGFASLKTGLMDAGMPEFERPPDPSAAQAQSDPDGDFSVPPNSIGNVRMITVADLAREMKNPRKPSILDVGIGAATVAEADWMRLPESKVGGLADWIAQLPEGKTVIVVGSGFYGIGAYTAARRIAESARATVELLIGGEEALAATNYPTVDRRSP